MNGQVSPDGDRDMQIVRCLLANPVATRTEIARITEIPESTVQRRLNALQKSGSLQRRLVLSPENRFFPMRSMISLNVETDNLRSEKYGYSNQQEFASFLLRGLNKFSEFSDVMGDVVIEHVEIVLGGPKDLIILVSGISAKAVAAFLTVILRTLPGIIDTNTATLVSFSASSWTPNSGDQDKNDLKRVKTSILNER